ncbi:NAD(P)-binding protein [Periconia macrospinosa]|uniref:NAD(P)-binding protein n=1 Tax=Periconia macrospinosa TaxID=97972 RepID=A0A2V1DEM7_9PLEO|nr:NAD(P)-binding protein [Periconia macrospinosa]
MPSPKTMLITGCSEGGIATARDISKIPTTLSAPPNVKTLTLDVCSPPSIASAHFTSNAPTLDVIVNNAGAGYTMPLLDLSIDRAKDIYDINIWGPIHLIQAFSELLIARKGRIVNISTCGAVTNTPWIGTYTSSKAAFTTLSETLRLELAPLGVSGVTIMVGTVDSKFHDNEGAFELPKEGKTSLYAPVEAQIGEWASGRATPKGVSAEEFVKMILGDVVAENAGGVVWKGPFSGSMKWMFRVAPGFVADAAMSYSQGLKELKAHYDAKEQLR